MSDAPDPEALKQAFTAFKKRWKVTRLDDESRLGGGRPTTTGRASNVSGIMPPSQFPREVWTALAAQGRIKDKGGGFYAMP
ncbi:MAG: hypothetical protein IT437_10480 [Phycisphaerales bacterium]|nr:hypothetical protein [Phycisphaerales bacterium]